MQVARRRTLGEVLWWTRRDIVYLLMIALVPTFLYSVLGWRWISIPWLPVALIGTAVSFIIGFKNNASYDRAWEARKIWGGIVNTSRTWASTLIGYLNNDLVNPEQKQTLLLKLVHRHLAWVTALRYQLREPRIWESIQLRDNMEIRNHHYKIEEYENSLDTELKKYLPADEFEYVLKQTNKAAQIQAYQSKDIGEMCKNGIIDRYQQVSLQNIVAELYNLQGGSERIKNFPYPRQHATLNIFYIRIFTFLVPFGMLREFEELLGLEFVWLTIPLATLSGWIFTTMEKVGDTSENPFEGGANDTPITQISRNIEIDLLEMIRQPHELKPMQAQFGVLS